MPPLSWDTLQVVATDALPGGTGAGVCSTFVRSPGGHIFAVRDSRAEAVVPNVLIADEEVQRMIDAGILLATPKWSARQGHVVLVKSAAFSRACARVKHASALEWRPSPSGLDMAYLSVVDSKAWRDRCACDLLRWARERLGGRPATATLRDVEEVLRQALYACDRTSPTQRELYLLFGVLLGELAPERWPAVAASARLQIPGLDPAGLEAEVRALGSELLQRIVPEG